MPIELICLLIGAVSFLLGWAGHDYFILKRTHKPEAHTEWERPDIQTPRVFRAPELDDIESEPYDDSVIFLTPEHVASIEDELNQVQKPLEIPE